jgi:hypothetical protein
VAFLVNDGKKYVIFRDFEPVAELPLTSQINRPLPMSTNGSSLAWRSGSQVFLDGRLQPVEGKGSHPLLSDDGSTLAYTVGDYGAQSVVVNGAKGPVFESVGTPALSADGRSVAYVAEDEHGSFILHDGRRVTVDSEPKALFLSHDGRRLGYATSRQVFVDGKAGERFDFVHSPSFSPDRRTFAYLAKEGEQRYVVVDDRKLPIRGDPEQLLFSPDGMKVGYAEVQGREIWWRVLKVP